MAIVSLVGCDDADTEEGIVQNSALYLGAPSTDPGTAPRGRLFASAARRGPNPSIASESSRGAASRASPASRASLAAPALARVHGLLARHLDQAEAECRLAELNRHFPSSSTPRSRPGA